jgi:hypothetical protein
LIRISKTAFVDLLVNVDQRRPAGVSKDKINFNMDLTLGLLVNIDRSLTHQPAIIPGQTYPHGLAADFEKAELRSGDSPIYR